MTMPAAVEAWRARTSPGAQALLALGALAIVAVLAWLLVLDPLARDLASTEAALGDMQAKLAQSRKHSDELAGLAQAPPRTAETDARGAVERTLAQQGLRPAVTALQAKDRRIEITFEAIDFAALTRLVDALGREARVYPVEALLATRTAPGSVRAEVAFAP
jgi:type II secretory pathway component PulM